MATELAESTPAESVAQAREDLERIQAVRWRYADQLVERQRELDDMRRSSGERVLAATLEGDGAQLARGLGAAAAAVGFEIEMLERATEAALAAHREAITTSNRARGVAEREPIAPKRTELEAIQAAEGRLFDEVEQLQGVRPVYLGTDSDAFQRELQLYGTAVPPRMPKSVVLATEIDRLEQEAVRLESAPVREDGFVRAGSLDELLAANDVRDVEVIAPTPAEIRAWVAGQLEHLATLRADFGHGQAVGYGARLGEHEHSPDVYELYWTKGRIDGRSRSRLGKLAWENVKTGERRFE